MTNVLLYHSRTPAGDPQVRVVAVSPSAPELEQLVIDAETEGIEEVTDQIPQLELELDWVEVELDRTGPGIAPLVSRCQPDWFSEGFFWEIQTV